MLQNIATLTAFTQLTASITDTTFSSTYSSFHGGAIYLSEYNGISLTPVLSYLASFINLKNVTSNDNKAGYATLQLYSTPSGVGGFLFAQSECIQLTVDASTFTSNSASSGGNFYLYASNYDSTAISLITFKNTVKV
jgi:hypothetical protein